ncbi:MAG: asparaginase [Rhodospirillales bacterium]|nr:asparaginase [Rhodospirillales bacterium]
MDKIHFIITGGTIDSEYFPPHETAEPNKTTIIPEYINVKVRPHLITQFETICMLDSGDITDEIRQKIVQTIKDSALQKVIITHGTNTMTETAAYLHAQLANANKTIVLTGSMIPLKEFAMSDAGFNLGYAIAQAQKLETGVYICMNAHTFKAGHVTKNRAEARFEER